MGNAVIYRPAYDAEVEYLESTGTQYIDTGFRPDSTTTSFELDISFEGTFVYSGTSKTIIQQSVIEMDNQFSMNFGDGSHQGGVIFFWFGRNYDGLGGASVIANIALTRGIFRYSQGIVSYSGTSVDVNNSSFPPTIGRREGTMCILKDLECYNARLYGVKIWDNNVLIRDFIPVRIGSIGYMYDKVTKQLFANKGTGNFILGNDVSNAVIPQQRCVLYFGNQRSVGFERIYEEYEWLRGDGSAYIDTEEYYRPYSDYFDLIAKDNQYPNRVFLKDEWIFGLSELNGENTVRVGTYIPAVLRIATNIVYYSSTTPNWIDYCVNEGVNSNEIHAIHISKVTGDKYLFNYNGDTFSNKVTVKEFPNNFESTVTLKLFNTCGLTNVFNGAINKYIHYRDNEVKCNLIPCKLLQSIPAILDGNGIARQAGECGMWDKVSNKFYGNVANSGTFTVKGPKCYEEYKWLKNVVVGYVRDMMKLPILSYSFSFSRKILSGMNVPYFFTMSDRDAYLNTSNAHTIQIWNSTQGLYYSSGQSFDRNDAISIVSSTEGLVVNSQTIPQNTFPVWYIYFGANDTNGTENYTSSITVDGSVRYVPCKLTHGIPASMDANGIARPAGTCGMWDKVNDKFYGNVASSGTFTVSND